MNRPEVNDSDKFNTILNIGKAWDDEMEKKGSGIFVSSHEFLGVILEEFEELKDAIRENDVENINDELLDIAVSVCHALASIQSEKMDWC